MPVDVQKTFTVQQMLESGMNVMKAANGLLTGAQDPAVQAFNQSLTGAIDMLNVAFKALGEIVVQLAEETEKMRNDGSAMHAAVMARNQEEAAWAERAEQDERDHERDRNRRSSPFG